MFLAATLGQLLASTCNPMLSAQVFLRLGNHAGKYLPFFSILPGLFLYHWQLCIFSALFTGVVPNEHLVLLLLYYAHQL